MVKFFVDKSETLASVAERISSVKDVEVVLVIPRDSTLKESVSNFHLLKREATAHKKQLYIESVDEAVLTLAKAAKIEAVHSLFRQGASAAMSDIVSPREASKAAPAAKPAATKAPPAQTPPEAKIPPTLFRPGEKKPGAELPVRRGAEPVVPPSAPPKPPWQEEVAAKKKKRWVTPAIVGAAALAVLFLGLWVGVKVFGRAEVVIAWTTVPWEYTGTLRAVKTASAVETEKNLLPAQAIVNEKNVTQLFPASERKEVARKATGKITIYNAYSVKAQELIATTRFETPDGKIFRLVSGTVVPGAKTQNGKLVPASVEAAVAADKPGPEYNVGPVEKLTLPAFRGRPQFNGFYGTLTDATTGGFIGETAVPTEEDIAKAKEKVTQILTEALRTAIVNNLPDDVKILEEASTVNITRLVVGEETDEKGNFSVFGKAEMRAVLFRETDVRAVLNAAAGRDFEGKVIREVTLNYKDVRADMEKGEVGFTVEAKGSLQPAFAPDEFRAEILGETAQEVRTRLNGLPDVANAKVSLWPFWLRRVPQNADRVKIVVE